MSSAQVLTSTPNSRTLTTNATESAFKIKNAYRSAERVKPWIYVNVAVVALIFLDLLTDRLLTGRFFRVHGLQNSWLAVEKALLIVFSFNSIYLMFLAVKPFLFYANSSVSLNKRQMKLLGVSPKEEHMFSKSGASIVPDLGTSLDVSIMDLSWLYKVKERNSFTAGQSLNVSRLDSSSFSQSSKRDNESFSTCSSALPSGRPHTSSKRESYAERLDRMRRAKSASPFVTSSRCLSSGKQLKNYLKRFKHNDLSGSYVTDALIDEDQSPVDQRRYNFSVRSNRSFFDESSTVANESSLSHFSNSDLVPFVPQSFLSALPECVGSSHVTSQFDRLSILHNSARATADFSRLVGQKYKISPVVNVDSCREETGNVQDIAAEDSFSALNASLSASTSDLAVWSKFGIELDKIDQMTHNCRVWIAKTVFKRLDAEIDSLNEKLISHLHLTIGVMPLNTLKQVVEGGHEQFPTLKTILPYLSLTSEQSALVARIKALSSGTCMAEYNAFKPICTNSNLTDFDIVVHCLKIYLMSLSAPTPLRIETNEFSRYFCLYPADPMPTIEKVATKRHPVICRESADPKLTVYYNGKFLSPDSFSSKKISGSNLFRVFVLFLQILKCDYDSKFGLLSLGPSGMNVSWILDC